MPFTRFALDFFTTLALNHNESSRITPFDYPKHTTRLLAQNTIYNRLYLYSFQHFIYKMPLCLVLK